MSQRPSDVARLWPALGAYASFAALLGIYYAAARLLDVRPAIGTSLSTMLGLRIVPDLMLAYVAGRAAWIGVVRTRGFADLRVALKADLVSRRTAERLLGIPWFVLGTVLAFDVYGAFKQAIPRLTSYRWDGPLAGIDWLLHLGRDPWTLTAWIPNGSWGFRLIDLAYTAWFLTLILTILAFATWAPLRLRARFFVSLTAILMVGGTLGAIVLASGGPAYFAEFTGDTERFAPLLVYLGGTGARDGQQILWEAFASGSEKLYGGISAMPSMHVAMVVLMALGFYGWNRALGALMIVYVLLIQIGSVHLGWHYAIDGYASILLTLWVWSISGGLLRRLGWPDPKDVEIAGADETPEPAPVGPRRAARPDAPESAATASPAPG